MVSTDLEAAVGGALAQSIADRFERQVAAHPQRIALKSKGGAVSYEGLNHAANRVAWEILDRGSDDKEPVALLFDQDEALIAALLGVLKAGRPYVPLDPAHPRDRTRFILQDSAATLLLTDRRCRHRVEGLATEPARILSIDAEDTEKPTANPGLAIPPTSLCYLLYTSGSTGQPKGVAHSHRSLLWDNDRQLRDLRISPEDRFGLLYSCNFSGAVAPLFGALLSGAALVTYDLQERCLADLARWLTQEAITVCDISVGLFRQFAGSLRGRGHFPQLRYLGLSGETVLPEDVALFRDRFARDCTLQVALGTTETRTVTQFFVTAETEIEAGPVPLGYPVAGKEVLLMNGAGERAEPGEAGEIVVRSRYLAAGYWWRPELTRERFLPDPEHEDCRLYRTGDLGVQRPDGCLFFRGRLDHQVKARGYRVELGEIEAVLAEHPDVRQAAVHLWTVKADDARIVACCVPVKAGLLAPISLRKHLRARLPEYMVPQYFLPVDAIPLTPNGKVDRRRLPTPVVAESGIGRHEAPADPIEATIAEIWTQLIHPPRPIGRFDKFFDMGGHSLLGINALRQIENKLGVRIEFRVLFQESLTDIATRCRSERIAGEGGHGGATAASKG